MKKFNITGTCIPHLHYMVNIDNKVEKVSKLVEEGLYFVISRPRQYGKTTTIYFLEQKLKENYLVISISFEGLGDSKFKDDETFCSSIFETFADGLYDATDEEKQKLQQQGMGLKSIEEVSKAITRFTREESKKIILIIDEVDRASNFNLFINFLGMLRDKYLKRNSGKDSTFHSVVLAGLHDIKNIKLKVRPDSEDQYNSPWNIATEFKVDMSFSATEIETMLVDYKKNSDHSTLDTQLLSDMIYKFTSGYPFLVSKVCKVIDEELDKDWTKEGIQKAISKILGEQNTLFDDMIKNVERDKELNALLKAILVEGKIIDYNADNPVINKGIMYGLLKEDNSGKVTIANHVFEVRLYNYLASKIETANLALENYNYRDNFIDSNGNLEMEKILLKFQQFIKENYHDKDGIFYERHGRLLLIAFVKPIVNGRGFYYIESQTSFERRRDMVITFNKKEYILEFKLWQGKEYHEKGLKQLAGYLETKSLPKGYLIVFNFNKKKEFTSDWNTIDDKEIFEVLV